MMKEVQKLGLKVTTDWTTRMAEENDFKKIESAIKFLQAVRVSEVVLFLGSSDPNIHAQMGYALGLRGILTAYSGPKHDSMFPLLCDVEFDTDKEALKWLKDSREAELALN